MPYSPPDSWLSASQCGAERHFCGV